MEVSSVRWTNWHEQLKEVLTGTHGQERENAGGSLVLGIVLSGCAVMQRVAETGSRARPQPRQDEQH
jgi:hypothetical protein